MLTQTRILRFWAPLAATWLMMAAEGPFVAALMARLPEAKYNLAAFGVAFSLALLIEAPVIMIMSASTALVRDRQTLVALRRFTWALNLAITVVMGVLLVPPVFHTVAQGLIGLPQEVARLTHGATLILLPWPAAIGYRRFYHGILIRHGLTRRVAYGTAVRLSTMVVAGVVVFSFTDLPGAYLGAVALSVGVIVEGVVSRLMVAGALRGLMQEEVAKGRAELTLSEIVSFYAPLALTSLLALGVHPLVTFFLGQSRMSLESLAVLPVMNSLVFIFRSVGLAYQEVSITLVGERGEGYVPLRRFAGSLALVTSGALAVLAFTPMGVTWYGTVSGLSPVLTSTALLATRVVFLLPGLEVLLSFQRAVLVHGRRTGPITSATMLEVTGVVGVLAVGIMALDLVGIVAAAWAFIIGRLAANAFLLRPVALARLRVQCSDS